MLIDIQIPEWARWVAQDANGSVWWFTHKPVKHVIYNMWVCGKKGRATIITRAATPPSDWTKTLKRVER